MELTVDQALKKGIEAHKAGKFQEADRYYTAILKANPKHPDANHNMGVLAVSVGKVEVSLTFFETALEANAEISQFWLSYIDAFIKLGRLADAEAVFDQAKSKGAKGNGFDKLELELKSSVVKAKNQTHLDITTKPNILDEVNLKQAIKLAQRNANDGQSMEANHIYQDILKKFPKNKRAIAGIRNLSKKTRNGISKTQEPPQGLMEPLVNLYYQGQFEQVLKNAAELLFEFPRSFRIYNIIGAANQGLGKLLKAVEAYRKALTIKPDYAEAQNDMGVALQKLGKLNEALKAFEKALFLDPKISNAHFNIGNILKLQNKPEKAVTSYQNALSIKPDYAEAYYNMGVVLHAQRKLDKAIEAYKKALHFKSDFAAAQHNMANALKDMGKLKKAIKAYQNALSIKPDYIEAIENFSSVKVQLIGSPLLKKNNNDGSKMPKAAAGSIPKYEIISAIGAFLNADLELAQRHLKNFNTCNAILIDELSYKNRTFCSAYYRFLSKLVEQTINKDLSNSNAFVYHIGDSHCLSFAHQYIDIGGLSYRIFPKITVGAKAFHFSRKANDEFKSITKENFNTIPEYSKVFISFGEIDCRPDEGFITAAMKLSSSIQDLIADTVRGYFDWFSKQNMHKNHNLFFFNVPAPIFDEKYDAETNSKVASTIKIFNEVMRQQVLDRNFKLIDVFKVTVSNNGFSDGLFHLDNRHLKRNMISEIEKQFEIEDL